MARPRAYHHEIHCPDCDSNWMPQNGASKGRQVYRCGDCHCYYTHGAAYTHPSAADREKGGGPRYGEGVSPISWWQRLMNGWPPLWRGRFVERRSPQPWRNPASGGD